MWQARALSGIRCKPLFYLRAHDFQSSMMVRIFALTP
jgi:hypothetical protein